MALVFGVSCRFVGLEERMGPSVVSLARSLVSECLAAAPDGWERMVFRVELGPSPFAAPRETWEWR